MGEGKRRGGRIPVEEATTYCGLIEPFVRIKREGVCAFKSGKRIRNSERGERAICPVNMQPKSELAAKVRNPNSSYAGLVAKRMHNRRTNTADWLMSALCPTKSLCEKIDPCPPERSSGAGAEASA
jgi:hypothetical protein